MTPLPRLIVFAKTPAPGLVKTRLVPPLTEVQAAALAEAFLLDTLASAAALARVRVDVAYSPPESGPAMTQWLDRRWARGIEAVRPELWPQDGADLGRRMCAALAAALDDGAPAAVIVGSDSPDLPPTLLPAAFAALATADAVLGPCPDGGYYLWGTRRAPALDLLDDIAWSSGGEADATRARLRGAGFTLATLPPWPDVDTATDLRALCQRLTSHPDGAPHTRAWLGAERRLDEGPAT